MDLAEIDLKLRGPGEIYGTKQQGLPDLKIASFTDLNLIQKTRAAAIQLLTSLPRLAERDGSLLDPQNSPLKQRLEKYKIRDINPS